MSLDALGRRSRFKRMRIGKRIVLGQRDIHILSWLYRYRYVDRDHLLTLAQPKSHKRFIERLGDLFHETGYIKRPLTPPQRFDTHASPMLYEISNAGIAYLEALDALPHRAVTFSRRPRRSYNPQFLHTMLIIDTLISIERATMDQRDQRFVPVDEILARAPVATRNAANPLSAPVTILPSPQHPLISSRLDTHLIPDALYGIEYLIDGAKRYRFWALECERTGPARRSTTEASSRARKRAAYDALIRCKGFKSHWSIPNLKVRFVSGS